MTDNIDIKDMPLAIAVCCREWPVIPFMPIAYCGLCGEKPVIRRDEK